MSQTIKEVNITSNTDTFLVTIPKGYKGITVTLDGDFDSATATIAYAKADDTVVVYNDPEASCTSDAEISVQAGEGKRIYVNTAGGGSPDIDVGYNLW